MEMNKKMIKTLGKLIAAIVFALTVVIISGAVRVRADSGKTVRVSSAKELKAAIKNEDVGTIIFRTNAHFKVTIKADKAAKGKSLIIDAQNVVFTNKAVFADINILQAKQYIESVSGNSISLSDCYMPEGIIVSKKKKVASLKIFESTGNFFSNITLRKGAKIKEQEWIYSGAELPVKSSYNKSKRQLTLKCTNDGCEYSYTVKYDKSGRMVSIDSVSNWPEATYDETYKYDANGNIVKIVGHGHMSGEYTHDFTYSGDLMQKSVYKDEYSSGVYEYSYDKAGNLTHEEYRGKGSVDGETSDYNSINDYEYDKNGRRTYERWDDPDYGTFYETTYTYDSKGFMTASYNNNSGSESVYKFKYDKAGNLINTTYTAEGCNDSYSYTYDEFGVRTGEKVN